MRPRNLACAVLIISAFAVSPRAAQRGGQGPLEIAWIGLYNSELLDWIENENRLGQLCTAREGSEAWHACRNARLEPKVTVIAVRSAPETGGRRIGEIVLVALPGVGLKAFASTGATTEPFTPDLYDADFGYGPWFHQSLLSRRGSWFLVSLPTLGAGWIHADEWSPRDAIGGLVKTLGAGDIVETTRGDMFVLGVEPGTVRLRPEQAADMWCEAGDPPRLAPWQEVRVPVGQLLDQTGHFRITFKYTRGC
jgi:hypothetical protein